MQPTAQAVGALKVYVNKPREGRKKPYLRTGNDRLQSGRKARIMDSALAADGLLFSGRFNAHERTQRVPQVVCNCHQIRMDSALAADGLLFSGRFNAHERTQRVPQVVCNCHQIRLERFVIPTGAGAPATAEWRDLLLRCDQTPESFKDSARV